MARETLKIGVVGAGAAGYFAAIRLGQSFDEDGKKLASVSLLEASNKPLSKVLISGGGRCNVTNGLEDLDAFLKKYPRGAKELRGVFHRFSRQDTVDWFEKHGVPLKTEADGRMFPVTNSSQSVADCLQQTAKAAGVNLRCKARVESVTAGADGFKLAFANNHEEHFDRIVLCTGGSRKGYEIAESLGHTIVAPVPSLFSFGIDDPRLAGLQGLSFSEVSARLFVEGARRPFSFSGPLLITHWGLSGPLIITLSARAARALAASSYHAKLELNFLPGQDASDIEERLRARKSQHPKRSIAADPLPEIPRRYWQSLVAYTSPDHSPRWAELSNSLISRISQEVCRAEFNVSSKGAFKDEFVTCGGVSLKEVDFRTMQSKRCKGLYFAGEILDIDGITGGFNFQSAWSTAWIAGSPNSHLV